MTADALAFLGLAAIGIGALLAWERTHRRMFERFVCAFCGGKDGKHAASCVIHEHRRPAA